MIKAFLYDENGGVFRCMFAGLDSNRDAKWVNITPNEKTFTFEYNVSVMVGHKQPPLKLISLEEEPVKTKTIVGMINNLMRKNKDLFPLRKAFNRMCDIDLKWEKEPIEVIVTVFINKKDTMFPYTLFIEAIRSGENIGKLTLPFADLTAMFDTIGDYMVIIEVLAKIKITNKTLCVDEGLKNEVERYLCRFDKIVFDE